MDILAGGLSGGGCSRAGVERWGNATFILAVNPESFGGSRGFEAEVRDLVAYVKSSRPAPGVAEILIPGEPEARERERRSRDGIFVADQTWDEIAAVLAGLRGQELAA
jgi:uncharacterized oxidoreductase